MRTGLLLLSACSSFDYGMSKGNPDSPGTEAPVDLAMDIAYQSTEWGSRVNRCQVQVAFRPVTVVEPGDEPPAPPQAVELPEEPGDCRITDMEAVSQPMEVGSEDDDWQVGGEVIGPEAVYLHDGEDVLVLGVATTATEDVRYELPDCSASTFPFSRTFALQVPASEDPNGVHPFEMSELVAVGPQVRVSSPPPGDQGSKAVVTLGEDLDVSWTLVGDDPTISGEPVEALVKVMVLQQDLEREIPDRWLVCLATEEGTFTIPGEELETLAEGRREDRFITTMTVHLEVEGVEQATPWGRLLRVGAHTSDGAALQFVDGD